MNLQFIIVIAIILVAVIFAARTVLRKRRAFTTKTGCADDCGCGNKAH